MKKSKSMKRMLAMAMSGMFCLQAGVVMAQQTQYGQTQPGTTSGSSGSSTTTTTTATPTSPGMPIAGRTTLGVSTVEMQNVVLGWSALRDVLGKVVYNDQKDRIGKIDDLIITPAGAQRAPATSYAIVGVGGFLGIGKHDVAIPMEQIKLLNGQLTLSGATKESLKALPVFEYARR